jgi:hypothetical protein
MTPKLPQPNTAAYRAAAHLSKSGPLSVADLFSQVLMAERACNRPRVLQRAIDSGWLVESFGKIDCGSDLRKHFDGLEIYEPKIKPVEQKATSRTNSAYDRPPLRYFTNSRGDHVRPIDERFQRGADHHFFSVPGAA